MTKFFSWLLELNSVIYQTLKGSVLEKRGGAKSEKKSDSIATNFNIRRKWINTLSGIILANQT